MRGELHRLGVLRNRRTRRIRTVRRGHKPNESPNRSDPRRYNQPFALANSSVAMVLPSDWRERSTKFRPPRSKSSHKQPQSKLCA